MLRRSTRTRHTDEPEPEKRRRTALPPLPLAREDAHRIAGVLREAAPHLLHEPKGHPLGTLLDGATSLNDVWAAVDALVPTHRARPSAHGLGALLLVRHMLAELAHGSTDATASPAAAYALHMHLPMGEYFSSAACLTDDVRDALQTAGADIVAVAPAIATHTHTPTLGERLPPPQRASLPPQPRTDREVPTTFLSYGTYCASLGPTHDSAGSTLTPATSADVWRDRRAFKREVHARWGGAFSRKVAGVLAEAEEPEEEEEDAPAPAPAALAAEAATLDDSLSADLLHDAITTLDVDAALARNWALVRELQDIPWLRTRATYPGARPAATPEKLAAQEQELAAELLESLTALLLAKAPTPRARAPPRPLLLASIAALATSVTHPPAGYYGTLDGRHYAPTTRAQLDVTAATPVAPPVRTTWAGIARPAVLADNCVARWTPGVPPGALSKRAAEHAGTPGDLPASFAPVARTLPYARSVPYSAQYAATRSGRTVRPGI